MEFNISQKTDPETENFEIHIDGDKGFLDSFNKIAKLILDAFASTARILAKQRESEKSKKPIIYNKLHTIKMDEISANKIIDNNPDLIDRIVLVKEVDDTVIGIRIK